MSGAGLGNNTHHFVTVNTLTYPLFLNKAVDIVSITLEVFRRRFHDHLLLSGGVGNPIHLTATTGEHFFINSITVQRHAFL